jgi:type 1 fimbriae regulatory protein FimB/type 1 fimbriae regulatory protein FimE
MLMAMAFLIRTPVKAVPVNWLPWSVLKISGLPACGYALANKGHDTRAIQAWLGHRSITSTAIYTALAPNRFRRGPRQPASPAAKVVKIAHRRPPCNNAMNITQLSLCEKWNRSFITCRARK